MPEDSPAKKEEGDDDDAAAGKCNGVGPSVDEGWCTPPSTKYKLHGAPWPSRPETKHVAGVQIWGPLWRRRQGGREVQVDHVALGEMDPCYQMAVCGPPTLGPLHQ